VLDRQDGPTVVAGHSYGGQIMTALGADAPNVVGLVYITAFGLDEGESIGGLLAQGGPPTPALAHLDIDKQGLPGCRRTTSSTTSRPTSIPLRPATWRWSRTQMTWLSSSRPPPTLSRPPIDRLCGTDRRD
jgi:pimeloyl-ACP methyl ester carboxylesterase